MGTGIVKGIKKVGKAVGGGAKAVGKVVNPANVVAKTIDKTVDTFKDDEFLVHGESELQVFGVTVGRITHALRIRVADKE